MDRVRVALGRHWLFGLALAAAVVLRLLVMLAFRPVMWFGGDSASYLATALRLVPDPSRAGGYAALLWLLRPLHSFAAVGLAQHAMGLAVGIMVYALARRYGLPSWAATLASLPVLYDAYQLQLESDIVPDSSFGLLVVVALYLMLRIPGERRVGRAAGAAFLLGLSAVVWPVGLPLLVVLLVTLVIRRAALVALAAAVLAGALPVVAYAGWFDLHEHEFGVTTSDGVFLWARTMSFANCAVIKPPARESALCPPAGPGPRMAASVYVWDANSPLARFGGAKFSPQVNALARDFALRAIEAQPGGYAAAVAHDFALSFYWDRPVHPSAGIVDRYQFADATTAWVPAGMRTPGGGTVARDQAAYNGGRPAPTRAVQPFASWLVGYQRVVFLPGMLLGVILLAALAAMIARRRSGGAGMAWAFALTIVAVPPLIVDFDLRYLVPAVPAACLAAALAFAPRNAGSVRAAGPAGRGAGGQRRWRTSPAATGSSVPDGTRTTSLPSESTPTARPESG